MCHQLLPYVGCGSYWPGCSVWSCHFLQGIGTIGRLCKTYSKTLLYVTSHSFNISCLGCDSLSMSKPSFSAITFHNSLPNSFIIPLSRSKDLYNLTREGKIVDLVSRNYFLLNRNIGPTFGSIVSPCCLFGVMAETVVVATCFSAPGC